MCSLLSIKKSTLTDRMKLLLSSDSDAYGSVKSFKTQWISSYSSEGLKSETMLIPVDMNK